MWTEFFDHKIIPDSNNEDTIKALDILNKEIDNLKNNTF